jgi:hypothetical protein
VIRNYSIEITLAFLQHLYDEDRVTKKGVMQQYIAQFKMLFNRENGRHMDTNDAKEAFEGKLLPCLSLHRSISVY